jgi:hypothetical protein
LLLDNLKQKFGHRKDCAQPAEQTCGNGTSRQVGRVSRLKSHQGR